MQLTTIILPELILGSVACLLILLGVSNKPAVRRSAAAIALVTLVGVFLWLAAFSDAPTQTLADPTAAVRLNSFGHFIKLLTAGVGILLVLLNWPTNPDATGSRALNFGEDAGEFFGLMLLSLAGLMLVASANDLILLFLAIEMASLPAYVMVSISRPLPVAQEAGVKYFFLGAMAAAILLFGLSYLYGSTGQTSLYAIATALHQQIPASSHVASPTPVLTTWQLLSFVIIIAGLLFKLAAAPFHAYVGDVYEGAATPVTAFLGFVPKTSGLVALLKILFVASGGTWHVAPPLVKLIWWIAALTMTVGNVLGVLQKHSVKRALAYSSVAHSGYLLVGVAALLANPSAAEHAIESTLFYLAAYALMNTGAFAVLAALPARDDHPDSSAETYDDLAGVGRKHVWLGLAMAAYCFSLIGLPLTVGFFGKLMIVQPALTAGLYGLVVVLVVNAGISAAYYLRIVGAIFLRHDPAHAHHQVAYHPHLHHTLPHHGPRAPLPISLAVILPATAVLLFGIVPHATELLVNRATNAAVLDLAPDTLFSPETPVVPVTAQLDHP